MSQAEIHNQPTPLFKEDYRPFVAPYIIKSPDIPSESTFYFTTNSGLLYEVKFARKKDYYLENIINFSVLNDEFDDEYVETNRGEVYRIIATVAEIIRIYHGHHPLNSSYEFCGEFKDINKNRETSIRSQLFYREALIILHESWDIKLSGNRVVVFRKK